MTSSRSKLRLMRDMGFVLFFAVASGASVADSPLQWLQQLNDFPHVTNISHVEKDVRDYEIGLGAMQKIGGAWKFKDSERFNGTLTAYTWQIVDGFTSKEVMDELVARVEQAEESELMFACEGRACGGGVQWANRVFNQSVLYGREELQAYRAYSLAGDPRFLLQLYRSARTADRQYLHAQVLEIAP